MPQSKIKSARPDDLSLRLIDEAKAGNLKKVCQLIDSGADLECMDKNKATPLVHAAALGHIAAVKELLKRGAKVDHQAKGGETALSFAAFNGHEEVVRILLSARADVRAPVTTAAGKVDAFSYVAAKGFLGIVRLFLEHGANPNKVRNQVYPPAFAAQDGHMEVVKLLVEHGADVNKARLSGMTALMEAAARGHVELMRYLLKVGADLEKGDVSNTTALHYAAMKGQGKAVEELVKAGANVLACANTFSGPRLPSDLARKGGHDKVAQLLEKYEKEKEVKSSSRE